MLPLFIEDILLKEFATKKLHLFPKSALIPVSPMHKRRRRRGWSPPTRPFLCHSNHQTLKVHQAFGSQFKSIRFLFNLHRLWAGIERKPQGQAGKETKKQRKTKTMRNFDETWTSNSSHFWFTYGLKPSSTLFPSPFSLCLFSFFVHLVVFQSVNSSSQLNAPLWYLWSTRTS